MPEQIMPNSLDAEKSVLGAILLDNSLLSEAMDALAPADFYREAHRNVFSSMLNLAAQHSSLDFITLKEDLERDGRLDKAGGISGIASLVDGVPLSGQAAIREYARIVKEKASLRRIIEIARGIAAEAYSASQPPAELAESAISKLLQMEAGMDALAPAASFRAAALSLMQMLESRNLLRIETGIKSLDSITGGFLAGELVVFTAEVGAGKTLLAQQTRLNSCRRGLHGLFASAEMTKEQLVAREIATEAHVERYKMRFPDRLTQDDWARLARSSAEQCEECEILEGEITMPRIFAAAKRMKSKNKLSLIVIDYDELVSAAGRDEFERQAAVASAAKSLARTMQVPAILISQLRKLLTGEDRRQPTLDRLYGAGAKRKHASTIIFVWRKYLETHAKEDQAESAFVVLKNRNGTQGRVPSHFETKTLTYHDVERDESAPLEKPKGRPPKPAVRMPFADAN